MKHTRTKLLFTCFLFSTIFSFAQSIQDYKGVWEGQYIMHISAGKDSIFNMHFNFSEANGRRLSGSASIYDNNNPMKLIGTNDDFEVSYNNADHTFSYENTTELPNGTRCKGKYVYHFESGANYIVGKFISSKSDCIQIDALLSRPTLLRNQPGLVINNKPENKAITNNDNGSKAVTNDDYEKEAVKQGAIAFFKWEENVWEKTPFFNMILNKYGKPVSDESLCPCTVDWNAAQKYFDWMKIHAEPVSDKYLKGYKAKMIKVENDLKTAKTDLDKEGAVEDFYTSDYHFIPGNAGAPKYSQSGMYSNSTVWNINLSPDGSTAEVNTTFTMPSDWNNKVAAYKMQMIKENGTWKIAAPLYEGDIQNAADAITSNQKNDNYNKTSDLITQSTSSFTSTNPEINQLADCQRLVNTGKTQAEKDELQKDYWTLLGIVSDLSNYRQMFLQNGKLIDLFPTAYYHTTYVEMQNILKLQFTYPIETMKQMISFYDAYKFNRNLWDNGMKNNVEPHWRDHFEYAERAATDLNFACSRIGFVLSTAIAAHVQCDLPRAIKYSYDNRFDKLILSSNTKYSLDYAKANELFATTKYETVEDISNARHCSQSYLVFMLDVKGGAVPDIINKAYEEYNTLCNDLGFKKILTDADVINLRKEAWRKAFAGKPFTDINGAVLLGQPITDHNPLIRIGKNLCPPTPPTPPTPPSNQTFKILPEWVTHPTDKDFKWFDWDQAPEDLKVAAGYIVVYKNKTTSKPVTLLDQINDNIKSDCSIKIAAMDLDDDGICGLATLTSGNTCCGSRGCSFSFFDNAGLEHISLDQDYEVKISNNGVISSAGIFFKLQAYNPASLSFAEQKKLFPLFTYDKTKKLELPIASDILGGKTPEELGKYMLKALQTNNKKLWASCIHPTYVDKFMPNYRQENIDVFDGIRASFESEGLTEWSLVSFSRVTFNNCPPCAPPGEIWLTDLKVEFWYKNKEFLGYLTFSSLTYQGKYFVRGYREHNMERYTR